MSNDDLRAALEAAKVVAHVVRPGTHRLSIVIDEETTDDEKNALMDFMMGLPKIATALARLDTVERGLSADAIAWFAEHNGGREVHRSWRDTMLSQGREVDKARKRWERLPVFDRVLDRTISRETLMDFAAWVLGGHALAREEQDDERTR